MTMVSGTASESLLPVPVDCEGAQPATTMVETAARTAMCSARLLAGWGFTALFLSAAASATSSAMGVGRGCRRLDGLASFGSFERFGGGRQVRELAAQPKALEDLTGVLAQHGRGQPRTDGHAVDPPGATRHAHLAELLMVDPQLQTAALDLLVGEDLVQGADRPGGYAGPLEALEEVRARQLAHHRGDLGGEVVPVLEPQAVALETRIAGQVR